MAERRATTELCAICRSKSPGRKPVAPHPAFTSSICAACYDTYTDAELPEAEVGGQWMGSEEDPTDRFCRFCAGIATPRGQDPLLLCDNEGCGACFCRRCISHVFRENPAAVAAQDAWPCYFCRARSCQQAPQLRPGYVSYTGRNLYLPVPFCGPPGPCKAPGSQTATKQPAEGAGRSRRDPVLWQAEQEQQAVLEAYDSSTSTSMSEGESQSDDDGLESGRAVRTVERHPDAAACVLALPGLVEEPREREPPGESSRACKQALVEDGLRGNEDGLSAGSGRESALMVKSRAELATCQRSTSARVLDSTNSEPPRQPVNQSLARSQPREPVALNRLPHSRRPVAAATCSYREPVRWHCGAAKWVAEVPMKRDPAPHIRAVVNVLGAFDTEDDARRAHEAATNNANRRLSRYRGVFWHTTSNKWTAVYPPSVGRKSFGYHSTEQQAVQALEAGGELERFSTHRGLVWLKSSGQWRAEICWQGEVKVLGQYDEKARAVESYEAALGALCRGGEPDPAAPPGPRGAARRTLPTAAKRRRVEPRPCDTELHERWASQGGGSLGSLEGLPAEVLGQALRGLSARELVRVQAVCRRLAWLADHLLQDRCRRLGVCLRAARRPRLGYRVHVTWLGAAVYHSQACRRCGDLVTGRQPLLHVHRAGEGEAGMHVRRRSEEFRLCRPCLRARGVPEMLQWHRLEVKAQPTKRY